MSFFSKFFAFLKKPFGKDANIVQTILTDITDLYAKAQPIVSALALGVAVTEAMHPNEILHKVTKTLNTIVKDAAAVDAFAKKNVNMSYSNLLANAAVFALSITSGVGIVKDLQLAVQLAYNVYAILHPNDTGRALTSSLGAHTA